MPNIASLLKSEISRVARKEVRGETLTLKKATSTHRSDIAALKRRLQALEQQLRRLSRVSAKASPAIETEASADKTRFRDRKSTRCTGWRSRWCCRGCR